MMPAACTHASAPAYCRDTPFAREAVTSTIMRASAQALRYVSYGRCVRGARSAVRDSGGLARRRLHADADMLSMLSSRERKRKSNGYVG